MVRTGQWVFAALIGLALTAPAVAANGTSSRRNTARAATPPADSPVFIVHRPEPPPAPAANPQGPAPAPNGSRSPQNLPTFALRAQPIQLATIIPTRLGFPTVIIFKEPIEEVLLGEQEQFTAEVYPHASSGKTWSIGIKPLAAGGVSGLVVITQSGYYRFVLQEATDVNPAMTVEVPLPGEATTTDPMMGIAETLLRIARAEMPPPPGSSRRIFDAPRPMRSSAFMQVNAIGGAYYKGFTCLILEVKNPSSDAAVPLEQNTFFTEGVFGVGLDQQTLVLGPNNRTYLRPGDSTRAYVIFIPEMGDRLLFGPGQ